MRILSSFACTVTESCIHIVRLSERLSPHVCFKMIFFFFPVKHLSVTLSFAEFVPRSPETLHRYYWSQDPLCVWGKHLWQIMCYISIKYKYELEFWRYWLENIYYVGFEHISNQILWKQSVFPHSVCGDIGSLRKGLTNSQTSVWREGANQLSRCCSSVTTCTSYTTAVTAYDR